MEPILSFDAARRCYVLTRASPDLALRHDLTPDCSGPIGSYYTAREHRKRMVPVDNPYTVLTLMPYADDTAAGRLLDLWLEYNRSFADDSDFRPVAPDGLEYLPFQRAGIEYGCQRKNTMICDEPGLGKTVQALGIANHTGAEQILVVGLASIRYQWAREAKKWLVGKRRILPVMNAGFDVNGADVVIVSYEAARSPKLLPVLKRRNWDLLIIDEAHYVKSPHAKRTTALVGGASINANDGISERAARIVALTGSPIPNRPKECYTLLRALDFGAIDGMSYDGFCDHYNPTRMFANGHRDEKVGNLAELHARMRCRVMVRRLKEQVLKDLPDKRYELTYVETTDAMRKVIAAERLLDIDPEQLAGIDSKLWGQISILRREMGEAKIEKAAQHVTELLAGGVDKLVVFAYHKRVIAGLAEAFPTAAVITGATSPLEREAAKARFQTDPDCHVILGQLTAAGTGVDGLQTVCSHAVFVEASWAPGENEQCVDRLHRIGQKSGVIAQFLVVEGSLDERIIGGAIRKLQTIHSVLDRRLTHD